MFELVNQQGQKVYSYYDFETWSSEERVEFLQAAIEMRIKYLVRKIDPRFLTSANVVNRRLKLPIQCYQEVKSLKHNKHLDLEDLLEEIKKIESKFFGAL